MLQIHSPREVKISPTFPVGGYQDGEVLFKELYSNYVCFHNVLLGNTMRRLADSNKLCAKTSFTNLRLILQYQEEFSDNLNQVSIDFDLIRTVKVGSWRDGQYNVSVEAEAPVGTYYFYWRFNRPHYNATLIWWFWFYSVLFRMRQAYMPLEFFENLCKLLSSCNSIIVPDDFRDTQGIDFTECEDNIGLRLIDNHNPSVDFSVFRRTWNATAGFTKPAEVSSIGDQSSSASSTERKYSVSDLCRLSGKPFDSVWGAAKTIGISNTPFDSFDANRICIYLVGSTIDILEASSTISSSVVVSEPAETKTIAAPSVSIYTDIQSGELPKLIPSKAEVPVGLQYVPEGIEGLKFCLANSNTAIQSFFNVLPVVGLAGNEVYLNDDSMLVSPFDESLYCQIVKENHKYSLAELYDQRAEEVEKRGQRFKKWGTLGGIFLLSPLLPFIAYNQGKASAPRGSRLEELIPDPQLQFLQDRNSFLAMTQASGVLPRLRRMIFHKVSGTNGTYYRIIPAVITQDSVIPCQVFNFSSTCFLRPVSAGIESDQGNYEARRIHRQYYHPRVGGTSVDTAERILIKGKDIEDQRFKLFQFSSDTRDLSYFYVDYPADPSHVF